jgi:hypothetical protein
MNLDPVGGHVFWMDWKKKVRNIYKEKNEADAQSYTI